MILKDSMGQLTVRLKVHQDQQIARVQELTHQRTATKALMVTLAAYEQHINEIRQLKKELASCNTVIDAYKDAHNALLRIHYEQHINEIRQLKKELASCNAVIDAYKDAHGALLQIQSLNKNAHDALMQIQTPKRM